MSERIHRAIDLAARAHENQRRKDRDLHIPYVAHVYGIAMIQIGRASCRERV